MKKRRGKMLRLIKSQPDNAAMNMAFDEILLENYSGQPVLRTYTWDAPYTTIGYFQKIAQLENLNHTRRLTGGLTVHHKDDISYSFTASSDDWKFIYNESNTYKYLHSAIQKALADIGIETSFLEVNNAVVNNICVQTMYANDLMYQGRKIVGSCLRRRGNKILAQGSVHIHLEDKQKDSLSINFAKHLSQFMNLEVSQRNFTADEITKAKQKAQEVYLNKQWNNKF
jgi:lipoate-protein ligase A